MRKTYQSETKYDVLELLIKGLPRKEIAERLGISETLLRYHVEMWYRKAGLSGNSDTLRIMAWARKELLVKVNEMVAKVNQYKETLNVL